MARSWIENLVAEYYRKKGYLVIENYSYFLRSSDRIHPGWQEIDVLATNEKEVNIISCKRGMTPNEYTRHPMFFEMHIRALRDSEYAWGFSIGRR